MHCTAPISRHNYATSERRTSGVAAGSLGVLEHHYGEIMRRNLISAALMAGLFLGAGAAPGFANALDSQLQPVATPIPRETVMFDGREAPGTIVVRTGERRLYLVLPDHQALRYGVGVGRPGFTWAGVTHIGYTFLVIWRADWTIRLARARCIWRAHFTESMAPMSPTRSGRRFRPVASA